MEAISLSEWIQAAAAFGTFLAAAFAAIIAARAPRAAAKFAEEYRAQSQAAEEKSRLQMTILMALLKCRSELLNQDARAAINMVDLAFRENEDVRAARRLFIEATLVRADLIVERYHALIEAVVRAMGYGDSLSGFDIRAGWYPQALTRIDEAALAEAEEKIARRALAQANASSEGN